MAVEIDGKHYSWTQPVCTDCWIEDNSETSADGTLLLRKPVRLKIDDREWEDTLEQCCKCARFTTSQTFIRIDPRTVQFPREDD